MAVLKIPLCNWMNEKKDVFISYNLAHHYPLTLFSDKKYEGRSLYKLCSKNRIAASLPLIAPKNCLIIPPYSEYSAQHK
jgi:hypothetical protein